MSNIQMVDLKGQYLKIKNEIDREIQSVIDNTQFINGDQTKEFALELGQYTGSKFVIPCGNGTDALQIAMMSLGIGRGDEVIVPSFTYVASAEVIKLLGATPVFIDVNADTFNLKLDQLEKVVGKNTRALIAVHLFGQNSEMEEILDFCKSHNIIVIEDLAQSIGAKYTFSDGRTKSSGTMGDIGCTSFFPSKNLGCFGDGGAIFCQYEELSDKIRMIANHGQNKKYHFRYVGVNSRLDTIQAAILRVKLRHLDEYIAARQEAANAYDELLKDLPVILPKRLEKSSHVFHQYTIRFENKERRDHVKMHLAESGIPSMIYYPLPLHFQEAYKDEIHDPGLLKNSEMLCGQVLSLPMHTELTHEQQLEIVKRIKEVL